MSELRLHPVTLAQVASKLNSFESVNGAEMLSFERKGHTNVFGNYGFSSLNIFRFFALVDKYNELTCLRDEWQEGKSARYYYDDDELESMEDYFSRYDEETSVIGYISIFQLYKYLGCIHYNLNIEGWGNESHLTESEKDEYVRIKCCVREIRNDLAEHILYYDERFRKAEWWSPMTLQELRC